MKITEQSKGHHIGVTFGKPSWRPKKSESRQKDCFQWQEFGCHF